MNRRGIITVDYIFALVLVMSFGAILFALSLTLTVAELTQYITFASARNYAAAHISPDRQKNLAFRKYQELIGHPYLTKLYTNGWFQIDAEPDIGDIGQIIPEYRDEDPTTNQFVGVGTVFVARMLEFQVPFYGSTAASGDGEGSSFSTFIGSYLGREVTTQECLSFVAQRWRAIRGLPVPGGAAQYQQGGSEQGYFVYDDNGC